MSANGRTLQAEVCKFPNADGKKSSRVCLKLAVPSRQDLLSKNGNYKNKHVHANTRKSNQLPICSRAEKQRIVFTFRTESMGGMVMSSSASECKSRDRVDGIADDSTEDAYREHKT
jgi:hypothetical protein